MRGSHGEPVPTRNASDLFWRNTQRVFHFVKDKWTSMVFSAALAVILDHMGFLRVLSKVSLLVVSSLASHGVGTVAFAPGMPVVVVINGDDFNTRYAERSPLNRCVLQADIAKVLAKAPSRLAIDFDLSPMADASLGEKSCQQKLDAMLDQHAGQLILLVPFPALGRQLLDLKHAWMQDRCHAGLHFADGNIEQSMGMVTEQVAGEDEQLGARMANQLHHGFSNLVCDAVQDSGDPGNNPWLTDARSVVAPERETQPINFPKAVEQLALIPLGSSAFDGLPSLAGSPVLFGGDWGKDDSFLTSIGTLPGVEIHAARLISLQDPIESLSPWVNLLSDLGIALCFAWVIEQFWEHYVLARRVDLAFKDMQQVTGLSSMVMLVFVCVYLSLVLFFFFVAEHLFAHRNVVIAPLLIALSMLIDGFVSGPVDAIETLLKPHTAPGAHAPECDLAEPSRKSSAMQHALVVSVLVLLAYFGLYTVLPDLVKATSALGFVGTLSVLYLLLFAHLVWLLSRSLKQGVALRWPLWLRRLTGRARLAAPDRQKRSSLYWLGRSAALGRKAIFWLTLSFAFCFLSGIPLHS